MMSEATQLIGKGLYSIAEVGKLIRIPSASVSRWVNGYAFQRHGIEHVTPPLIRAELRNQRGTQAPLTFLDLLELKFISMFRSPPHRVRMDVIRAAWERGAHYFNSDHPFCMARFRSDGKHIFAELRERSYRPDGIAENVLMEELAIAQLVFVDMVEPFCLDLAWDGDYANKYWPLGRDGRIVIDPRRSFGKPIDSETGMRAFTLYQASLSGESTERIAAWYDVPIEAILKSVEYEEWLQAA